MGLILITHDLGVVADVADKIAVMYAGRIVERADVFELYATAGAPVHRRVCWSRSRGWTRRVSELAAIKGLPPNLTKIPPGCAFNPRCRYAAGHLPGGSAAAVARGRPPTGCRPATSPKTSWPERGCAPMPGDEREVVLEVEDLVKHYPIKAGVFRRTVGHVKAVDGVSFDLLQGRDARHRGRVRLRQVDARPDC